MIRTVLVDDELDCIHVLKNLLATHCPEVRIVGEADGITTALDTIETCKPDLLFLDITMANGNGFDLLSQLDPVTFEVIFVTASNDHAIRAFKYSAVDYLLKPVDGDDLRKAVEKVTTRTQKDGLLEHMKVLLENMSTLQLENHKMALPTINGLSFVFVKDIMRLESKGSYSTIFLSNGQRIVTTRSIRDYEQLLPESIFYRVHTSHIINLNKVQKYQKGRGGSIIMEDNISIEVALRRKEDFLRRLLK